MPAIRSQILANPWIEAFPEILNYNNMVIPTPPRGFIGVKIGDINASAIPNSMATVPRSPAGRFDLGVAEQTLRKGQECRVSFAAEDLDRIRSCQFTLHFDSEALELTNMEYGLAQAEDFGMTYLDEGVILMCWIKEQLEVSTAQSRYVYTRISCPRKWPLE